MVTSIIGCEYFNNYQVLEWYLDERTITSITTCGEDAIDDLVKRYAEERNIPLDPLWPQIPDYSPMFLCKKFYYVVQSCDVLVAFWNGVSKKVPMMVKKARQFDKEVLVVRCYLPGKSKIEVEE